jgi:hypothetical protein
MSDTDASEVTGGLAASTPARKTATPTGSTTARPAMAWRRRCPRVLQLPGWRRGSQEDRQPLPHVVFYPGVRFRIQEDHQPLPASFSPRGEFSTRETATPDATRARQEKSRAVASKVGEILMHCLCHLARGSPRGQGGQGVNAGAADDRYTRCQTLPELGWEGQRIG